MSQTVLERLRALPREAFESYEGIDQLEEIVEELRRIPSPASTIPALFELLERLDDADLGAPGPVVHFLEKIGGYENELRMSLKRKPTAMTVWMAKRIVNDPSSIGAERASWLAELRSVLQRTDIREDVREEVRRFLG